MPGDSIVLGDDDPRRPQPPERATAGGGLGAALAVPLRPIGHVMEKGALYYEDHCGGVSGGLQSASIDACLPPWLSVHLGPIGPRSGFLGGGAGFHVGQHDRSGLRTGVTGAATYRGYQLYDAYLGWNDPERLPWIRLGGFYDLDAGNEFWGLGPDTDEDDRTDYGWERFGARLAAGLPPRRYFWGEVGIGYEKSFVFEGNDEREPDTVDRFQLVPGASAPQQEFWVPQASVVIDLTDAPGHPVRGFRLKGDVALYRSANNQDFDWTRYGAEAQVHVPLASEGHIISALAGFEEAEPQGEGDEIPFAYLPSLGGSRRLRGFDTWRFTDRATAFGTIAYRYRAWVNQGHDPADGRNGTLETVVFLDVGTVADDLDTIDLDDLESAYGVELRLYMNDRHVFGLGIAASEEGVRVNFASVDVW